MNEVVGIRNYVASARDLDVYKRAYALSLEIHEESLKFPKIEQYALADQIRRASKSICANLAEGFAKQQHSSAEFKRFVFMAAGSASEMQVWADYCFDLGYIDKANYAKLSEEYTVIMKMLYALHNKAK